MTIGENLLQVADAGLALCKMRNDEDIFTHLNVLMAIEDVLDQGRISISLSDSDTEHITEINSKMDELRGCIRLIIDKFDDSEFSAFMENRSRRLQTQFTK